MIKLVEFKSVVKCNFSRCSFTKQVFNLMTIKQQKAHVLAKQASNHLLNRSKGHGSGCMTALSIMGHWGSNQQELFFGSSHLRILSSQLIFTLCAGLHSSVFTCGDVRKIFSLHFFTLPKIVSSLSSHLRNHDLQSSQGPIRAPGLDDLSVSWRC